MTSKPRHSTDPAREFARLAQFLLKLEGNPHAAAYKMVQGAINGDKHGGAVLRIYGFGNKRVEDLASKISEIDDHDIDDDTRNAGLNAVFAMGKLFSPEFYHKDWNSVVIECLPKEHLLALTFLSPIMSRHYPLPVVQCSEIEALIAQLTEASLEIVESKDIPLWAAMPLSSGISDLLFVLENFVLFGHDEAVSRLLTLLATANHAIAAANASGGRRAGLIKLCVALALAVDVFAAAPNVSQAYSTYRGWMVDALDVVTPLLTPPPLRLEGPKQPDADAPEDA
ncbi:hypothetical protein E4V01_00400 [Methylorubrum sp. Q1]|uniref:hypothetical protein n=1 Tax=Methylorubrum sp. Q1 TaxID=2562453 RepID=UPI0010760967|nr:hypothetical protein [Methylorubrum sp. Q1]TFZ61109.1 hypothetical protein E4V01_00400 [Methylorubrum sp. Q1]